MKEHEYEKRNNERVQLKNIMTLSKSIQVM